MERHSQQADIQRYLARLMGLIAQHGWAIQGVMSNPPYSYTVGLADAGLPEVVVMGLDPRTSQVVLNEVARNLKSGALELVENSNFDEVFRSFPARFRKMDSVETADALKVAARIHGAVPLAWQLIWPDPHGFFPGDPEVDETFVAMQNLALARASVDSAS